MSAASIRTISLDIPTVRSTVRWPRWILHLSNTTGHFDHAIRTLHLNSARRLRSNYLLAHRQSAAKVWLTHTVSKPDVGLYPTIITKGADPGAEGPTCACHCVCRTCSHIRVSQAARAVSRRGGGSQTGPRWVAGTATAGIRARPHFPVGRGGGPT